MSKANRRFYRTIILGLAAMGLLIWTAMDQFGISRGEMAQLFLGTLLAAAIVIAMAALLVLVWAGLRKLLHRNDK